MNSPSRTTTSIEFPPDTAASESHTGCPVCFTLCDISVSNRCTFCRTQLELRKAHSIQHTLAYLGTSVLLYIPANLFPIMDTTQLGRTTSNTIAGGVITLWEHGSYPIASIIFIASIVIPSVKMMLIAWFCWFATRPKINNHVQLTAVFHVVELVGRWSMVDVFVVALLVALIQVGTVMTIQPGPAALAFAGVVIFTMLSARSFDTRLLWDRAQL